jgi:capsule polysaccharide modification protein KpsS
MIFYPFHYEPEAVLLYMGYFFDNQLYVIENILKCLSNDQILVVKEHPQQPGALLESKFRNIKRIYPNLLLVKAEEPTNSILHRASIIVTLGSTAGFEGLSIGKNIINLGRVFYDCFPGVHNCSSFEEVYNFIRKNTPMEPVRDFELWVARMFEYILVGNPFPNPELYSNSNIEAVRKAIENELVK